MNTFPRPISSIICEYAAEFHFLPWIDILLQDTNVARIALNSIRYVWENPNGFDMARHKNMDISWHNLSANPHPRAVAQLLANRQKINWEIGFGNPGLYPIIRENMNIHQCIMINVDRLNSNPHDECVSEVLMSELWIYPQLMTFEQWSFANMNPNEKMVNYLLSMPTHINHSSAWQNPHPIMFESL